MTFKPGICPNPGGKPKGSRNLEQKLKRKLLACFNLVDLQKSFLELWELKSYRVELFKILTRLFPESVEMSLTERRIIFDFSEPKQIAPQAQQIPKTEAKSLPMQISQIVDSQGLAGEQNVDKREMQS